MLVCTTLGDTVDPIVLDTPITLVILRCMLGYSPPEWAYCASRHTGVSVTQNAVHKIGRAIRLNPTARVSGREDVTGQRIRALIVTACYLLQSGSPEQVPDELHRLDKVDAAGGLSDIQSAAKLGIPYSVMLYERLLGRPCAAHRDSISEPVGNIVETGIEDVLTHAGISSRKANRAERGPGFDQAPDFIIPSEHNPHVVIEAKLTADDGTARDKVTRVQHLNALSKERLQGQQEFEVIACIAERGIGVSREDMRTLLVATRGKVLMLQNIRQLAAYTRLADFRTQ